MEIEVDRFDNARQQVAEVYLLQDIIIPASCSQYCSHQVLAVISVLCMSELECLQCLFKPSWV